MSLYKVEKKRARRRRLTLAVSAQRRAKHLRIVHGGNVDDVDCVCELADFYFEDRKVQACPCRKRRHGRPRVDVGMCNAGSRAPIYRRRQEVAALLAAARSGRDIDELERQEPAHHASRRRPFTLLRYTKWQGRWSVYRAYLTEAGRDRALLVLRRNRNERSAEWFLPGPTRQIPAGK